MKKIKLTILFTIIGLIIALLLTNNNDSKTFKQDGIIYALTLNDNGNIQTLNNFPSRGMYQVEVECSNAKGKWDYDNWKLNISDITGKVLCYIDFNTITKNYLNQKVIDLASTTSSRADWKVLNEPSSGINYRYEGKTPDNYVWFNNELWRIIGVFDSNTHGVANTNLVKIIRAYQIGGLAWSSNGNNDWANSSLYKLLNPVSGDSNSGAYYNKTNGTGNNYCKSTSTIGPNCDYTVIGIDGKYRQMIKQVTWKVGGHTTMSATASTFYEKERGTETGNSNGYAAAVTGYIGLMYPSDYGYSVLEKNTVGTCSRTSKYLDQYSTSSCGGQSWLYGQGYELTITPKASSTSNIFCFTYTNGNLNQNSTGSGQGVRPTLYLDASVYVYDGSGTQSDPYIIGM